MPLDSPTASLLPKEYEETPITSVVTRLPAARLAKVAAVKVVFGVVGVGPIRYLINGGTPTQGVGIPAFDGDREIFNATEANNLRMITTDADTGVARATYYYHV